MTDETFIATYEAYRNVVYSVAYNYVKNPEDAADLAQEAFIRLYTDAKELETAEHRKAWLIRTVINLCKNHLRSRKRFSNEPIPDTIPAAEETGTPDELLPIVMQLPEKYRIPLHLFYYAEYSITEIAKALELPEATVKTRLNRGREKLRSQLRKEEWLI